MRKYWLFVLAVVFMATLGASRVELIAYEETFDGDISEWHHYDGAESPNNWHIHDFGGAQGDVWWMGDPALASGGHPGGYYNRQYLVLDTPAQTLTAANATLTFKMRLGLEDPAPHDDYDGWDSANVRLSTDGGTTWQVIQGTPPYHSQALMLLVISMVKVSASPVGAEYTRTGSAQALISAAMSARA